MGPAWILESMLLMLGLMVVVKVIVPPKTALGKEMVICTRMDLRQALTAQFLDMETLGCLQSKVPPYVSLYKYGKAFIYARLCAFNSSNQCLFLHY